MYVVRTIYGNAEVEACVLFHPHLKCTRRGNNGICKRKRSKDQEMLLTWCFIATFSFTQSLGSLGCGNETKYKLLLILQVTRPMSRDHHLTKTWSSHDCSTTLYNITPHDLTDVTWLSHDSHMTYLWHQTPLPSQWCPQPPAQTWAPAAATHHPSSLHWYQESCLQSGAPPVCRKERNTRLAECFIPTCVKLTGS